MYDSLDTTYLLTYVFSYVYDYIYIFNTHIIIMFSVYMDKRSSVEKKQENK